VETRTGAQIRSHAQKYYNKKNKHFNNHNKETCIKEVQEVVDLSVETVPVKGSLLYEKILSHIKVVESLQRMYKTLINNPNDILAHIELTQGERLCEAISTDVKKVLPMAEKVPELEAMLLDLIGKVNNVHELILEMSPQLKETNYYKYLADLL